MSDQRFGIRIQLGTKDFFILLSTVEVKGPRLQLITSLCERVELYPIPSCVFLSSCLIKHK